MPAVLHACASARQRMRWPAPLAAAASARKTALTSKLQYFSCYELRECIILGGVNVDASFPRHFVGRQRIGVIVLFRSEVINVDYCDGTVGTHQHRRFGISVGAD